jgi:DNA-binding response OmpR family regulator
MSTNSYILLIEDSPSQGLQLQLLLQRAGFDVHIETDGVRGWRAAHTTHPHLILLDVNLPTLDGFQVLKRLKRDRSTAGIPVIVLSTSNHVSDVERAISLGIDDYWVKGDLLTEQRASQLFCDTIEQLIQQASQASSNSSS